MVLRRGGARCPLRSGRFKTRRYVVYLLERMFYCLCLPRSHPLITYYFFQGFQQLSGDRSRNAEIGS